MWVVVYDFESESVYKHYNVMGFETEEAARLLCDILNREYAKLPPRYKVEKVLIGG